MEPANRLPELLPRLRRVVAAFAAAHEVDDLTQECCLRIVEREGLWRGGPATLGAWISAVARNVAVSALRRRSTGLQHEDAPVDERPAPAVDVNESQVGWVLEQLGRLPEAQREVLHMRYYDGLTTAAIGERLGIDQSTASRRVAMAVDRLRRQAHRQGLLSLFLPSAWAASLAGASKMKIAALAGALGLSATAAASFYLPDPDTYLVTDTTTLERTGFAPGPDAALDPARNLLWCATLPIAWQELEKALGEPLRLQGDPPTARLISQSAVDRTDLDPNALVAMAGPIGDDIVDEIQGRLQDVFEQGRDPVLDELARSAGVGDALLAYAFLYKGLRWPVPFEGMDGRPMEFAHTEGGERRSTRVECFGIDYAGGASPQDRAMWEQVRVHDWRSNDDFLVRLLAKGSTDRVILARVAPKKTLEATWRHVRERFEKSEARYIDFGGSLKIPELDFDLTHVFSELGGVHLANPGKEHRFLGFVRQDLRLKLDEEGVELKSRAVIGEGSAFTEEIMELWFDEPFLLAMIEEGAESPYLLAWIAHPELLVRPPEEAR